MSEFQVPIRPAVRNLPRYRPGKAAPGAMKLSSNEMATPPSAPILEAMRKALENVNRYPDLMATPVREAIAKRFEVLPEQVCVGTGSSALLLAALSAVCSPGAKVVYPWRSFESYPIAIPASHAEGVPVPLDEDGGHDVEGLVCAAQDATALILCSPNNPTGPVLTFDTIRDIVERVPASVLVLVDEAYIDFASDPRVSSAIPLIEEHPNVLVLRTFSKVHALAGVRVGYAIGNTELIGAIQAVSVPFGVSSVAQAAALASLEDEAGVRASAQAVIAERERMIAALREVGLSVPDSQANFFFLPGLGSDFVDACVDAGLIVRPFPEGVRVTLADPLTNDRFLEVARRFAR
ncbi:histidinol-phosphate transaminase [Schaalia cardiffensis]